MYIKITVLIVWKVRLFKLYCLLVINLASAYHFNANFIYVCKSYIKISCKLPSLSCSNTLLLFTIDFCLFLQWLSRALLNACPPPPFQGPFQQLQMTSLQFMPIMIDQGQRSRDVLHWGVRDYVIEVKRSVMLHHLCHVLSCLHLMIYREVSWRIVTVIKPASIMGKKINKVNHLLTRFMCCFWAWLCN